jgi:hypothetical protein
METPDAKKQRYLPMPPFQQQTILQYSDEVRNQVIEIVQKELADSTRFVIPEPDIHQSPNNNNTSTINTINSVNTTIINGNQPPPALPAPSMEDSQNAQRRNTRNSQTPIDVGM